VSIIERLSSEFQVVKVLVDGLTSPLNKSIDVAEDDAIYQQIVNKTTSGNIVFESLIGKNYEEKMQACTLIDIFIANSGTGCMIPHRFLGKIGVIHSNTELNTFDIENNDNVKVVSKYKIINMPSGLSDPKPRLAMNISYTIDWIEIFNSLCDLIKFHYGKGIKKLEPRPPEVVASVYSRSNYYNSSNKEYVINSMGNVSSLLKDNYTLADLFRELAVSYENNFLYDQAKENIKMAKIIRPEGPVINRICNRLNFENEKAILGRS
jgi:hypothetical protein